MRNSTVIEMSNTRRQSIPNENLYSNTLEQATTPRPIHRTLHRFPMTDQEQDAFALDFIIPKENIVKKLQKLILLFMSQFEQTIRTIILSVLFIGYTVYFAFAIRHDVQGAMTLIVITSLVVSYLVYGWIRNNFGYNISRAVCKPVGRWWDRHWNVIKWFVYIGMIVGSVLYLAIDVIKTPRQLQSLAGLVVFFVIPWITSKHPTKINWRPVIWGMVLQFVIACLVLRWKTGYNAVEYLSNQFITFLSYPIEAGGRIFGDPFFILHPFVSLVIPMMTYMGFVLGILYYWGVIPWLAAKVGWLMSVSMHTTAVESVCMIVNIFLSVLEAVLMLKDYMPLLTASEFHCFLVAAHSTIAGFAFGLFIFFGINPQHLMTGAVISAPAAVAIAKLNYPETEQSVCNTEEFLRLPKSEDTNFIDAGIRGAWGAAVGVGTILIQVISFLGLFAFLDTIVMWVFARVDVEMDIATLIGYMFIPFSYLMGVDENDISSVGRLLGLKVTANEFLSYIDLGNMIREDTITPRSAAIATYAMCGFSSFGTLVIFAGVWNSVDPKRTAQVMRQLPRILMNANLSCFMTACVASILYTEGIEKEAEINPLANAAQWFFSIIPSIDSIRASLWDVVTFEG